MKAYLGDTVYAEVQYGLLKLTTEPGEPGAGTGEPDNIMYMSPEAVEKLLVFISQGPPILG